MKKKVRSADPFQFVCPQCEHILGRGKHFSQFLFKDAYEESKRRYEAALESFESDNLRRMAEQGLKIAKRKNESNLFVLVAKEYPDAIYQYHCDWLGLQSLDVYIPSLKVGIEYQGEQHYRPIEFFGGEPAFKEAVMRDRRKEDLCKSNGVELVYWRYDEPISKAKLKQKNHKCDAKVINDRNNHTLIPWVLYRPLRLISIKRFAIMGKNLVFNFAPHGGLHYG